MFNPFFARPIGTDQFEQHLLTKMVEADQMRSMEKEAVPDVKLILHAVRGPSRYDPIDEGYKALEVAIFARALVDYLEYYASWLHAKDVDSPMQDVWFSRCLTLENEYFRWDEKRASIFNYVLKNIVHKDFYVQERIKTIREFAHKIECAI